MSDTISCAEMQYTLSALNNALANRETSKALELFAEDCYWRDLLAFTWNIKTFDGKNEIRAMLDSRLEDVQPGDWKVKDEEFARTEGGITEGFFSFTTSAAHGYGYIRLKAGLIWTLLTTMQDIKGFEEPVGPLRRHGALHGEHQADANWAQQRETELSRLGYTEQPYVLIVGGGQGGLTLAARLRQHDVPTIVADRHERPGDSWRHRYETLHLHNPIWENHMPYLDLPSNWPIFSHKDKFADWLEAYTKIMELNYWGSTDVTSARFDANAQTWEVNIERDGEMQTLYPKHLVLATGLFGTPSIPDLPGQEIFEGVQQHSCEHAGPAGMEDKRVVVVGSGTSAHDISAAIAARGGNVTMIQRSPSYVVKSETFRKYVLGGLYSQEAIDSGITSDKADILSASVPFSLFFAFQKPFVDQAKEADRDFYQKLEATNFMLDYGPGGSGLFGKALTGANNYYIEIGASQMIIDGRINVQSGLGIKELSNAGVVLENGTEIPADVVIYATGFKPMSESIERLLSSEVAHKVGKIWGLGSGSLKDPGPWEGELRNMWKPTQQEGLWFHGSLIAHARFYSHFLALQLKARMEEIPVNVYGMEEPTHYR